MSMQVNAQNKPDSSFVEEIVVFTTRGINASGARYHLDGCRYLKNGQINIDERTAVARGSVAYVFQKEHRLFPT